MISSNNSTHPLSFLSLWKDEGGHHCILLPNVYGVSGCSVLLEYFSCSNGISVQNILSSPDFLFHTTFVEESLPLNVEHVRKLTAYAQNTAMGSGKVIVLQNIETASTSALNALLKIIEEPPKNTVFYMIYSNANSIPATVRSRSLLVRENITDVENFTTLANFLKLPVNFQTFINCGYDFSVYESIMNIKDLSFADILTKVQAKGCVYEEIFAFLEYKLHQFSLKQSQASFNIYKHIFQLRKQIKHLKINEQTVLIQLIEEVHALVRS
jgi:hypothetical protein